MRIPRFQLALLLACLSISAGLAQAPRKLTPKDLPPSAFKLISIKTTGTKRYKSEEIIAATGLQIGQTVSEDDFKKAARLLGETGAFGDVLYSFQYSAEGTKLDLQVQDAERFVPARFDNLVWFSDQELLDQLHAQVPLFQGQLPVAGDLADQVSNALQALLILHKGRARPIIFDLPTKMARSKHLFSASPDPRSTFATSHLPEPENPNCPYWRLRRRSCKALTFRARCFALKRTRVSCRFTSSADI